MSGNGVNQELSHPCGSVCVWSRLRLPIGNTLPRVLLRIGIVLCQVERDDLADGLPCAPLCCARVRRVFVAGPLGARNRRVDLYGGRFFSGGRSLGAPTLRLVLDCNCRRNLNSISVRASGALERPKPNLASPHAGGGFGLLSRVLLRKSS